MEWQDEGLVLTTRRHGENSVILEVLTARHGRHAGIVRGGAGRRLSPHLQPGTGLALTWRARLEDHLGSFTVEPVQARAGLLAGRDSLAALASAAALVVFALPERDPVPQFYLRTLRLMDALEAGGGLAAYAHWELALLSELGFGLDLSACAATGAETDLVYVSPRSGRAVSREAGRPYAEKLLPLPEFWRSGAAAAPPEQIRAALRTTGFFLQERLCPALGKPSLPPARHRVLDRVPGSA